MKKKIIIGLIGILSILALSGCMNQSMSRNFGGTSTVKLPAGKKLIEATWKDNDIWYLTRDMKKNEKPEIYDFIESSNYGVFEGKVIFKESK